MLKSKLSMKTNITGKRGPPFFPLDLIFWHSALLVESACFEFHADGGMMSLFRGYEAEGLSVNVLVHWSSGPSVGWSII